MSRLEGEVYMPTPYRYTTPVGKTAATGQAAAVYAQIARDFILHEPVADLPEADRPAARLALLAALALYPITDRDAAAWRIRDASDVDLVRLIGFGAITAVTRVEASICAVAGVAC